MRISISLALCSIVFLATSQTNPTPVQSTISDVTVFQQGAQVTRQGSVQLKSGNTTLQFKGLPQSLDPNSIILGGSGNLTVLSITHKRNFLSEEDKNEVITGLESQLEKLELRLQEITSAEHGLILEREVLEANRDLGGTTGFTLQELRATADFAKQRREENARQWYNLQNEKEEINKKKKKLQQQLNQEKQVFSQKTGVVEVAVEANSPVNASFELSYIVSGASWVSTYDVRVDDLTQPVSLTHKARINQQTGEDWENVNLTLATGNPSAGAQVPYMGVWYVNFQNLVTGGAPAQFGDAARNANTRSQGLFSKAEADEPEIGNQQFQVTQNLTQQEYTIDRRQTIASNNSPVTVVLRELSLPAKYEYHAKPRLDPDAFLVAKVYSWGQYDLLDGELSLFNNKTYVGKAYLNTSNPEDTLQLSLGRDKGVVVKRTRVYNKLEKTLFGSNRIDHFVWKIELRNNKKTAVDIVLRDQVPVAQNEEIKVTVNSVGGGNYDEKTGIIKWRFKLEPGQSRSYEVSYEVKYPKGRSGGVMYY